MKPYVTIVGLAADTVFICPPENRPTHKRRDDSDARATVYMNHFTSIRNVVLAKPAYSLHTDYAIWNKDMYNVKRSQDYKTDASDFSAFDVPIFPFPRKDQFLEALKIDNEFAKEDANKTTHNDYVMGKSILMEGDFSTTFMVNVGASYNYRRGFDVEIKGVGQNADCHIVDCFFDSLFLDPDDPLIPDGGGCIRVSNCYEVHIRNSLLRVGAYKPGTTQGAAVRVMGDAMVLLEGSSLYAPGMVSDRVLHVDEPTAQFSGCVFAHSSTDSVLGKQWVNVKQGLP